MYFVTYRKSILLHVVDELCYMVDVVLVPKYFKYIYCMCYMYMQ